MSELVEILSDTDVPQGQKRCLNSETEDAPFPKQIKLCDDNVQEKDKEDKSVLTNDEEQRNTAVSTAVSTSSNTQAAEHCATETSTSAHGDVKKEEAPSAQENLLEKNQINTITVLKVPSFPSVQADPPVIKNQRFVGTCMSCNNSLAGKDPLMLGCLHIYCSKCILQHQYFRLSSSMSTPKASPQDGNNSSAVHTSFEKLGDVSAIPEEVFESLDSLKAYIANNFDAVGRLVVKCKVCECNTRAKVISKNGFVAKANDANTNEIEEDDHIEVKKLCTNCEENSIAVRFCKNCDEHLCEECVNAHKRVKITKEHELDVIKSSENESAALNRNLVVRCEKHVNEEIKLFCETCNKLTCRDCQLEFHREHKYMFVSEAAESQAKILETMQSKLSEKKFFLDQTSSTIKTRLSTMLGCRDKANQDIVQFHQKLQEKATAKCQFFLNKIHEITSGRHIKLRNQLFATERLSSAVDHCVKFIDFAIEKQNSLALLESKQTILEYVTTVMRQKFTTNPVASSDIVFVPDNNVVKAITMKLGSLLWGEPASNVINLNHMQHPGKSRKSSGQFHQSQAKSSPTTPPNVSSHYPGSALHYRPTHNKNGMSVISSPQPRPMMQPHAATAMVSVPFTPQSIGKTQGYQESSGTPSQGRYIVQNASHGVPQPQAMHHHHQKRQVPNQQHLYQQRQFQQQFQQHQQQQQRVVRQNHQQVSRQNQVVLQTMSDKPRRFVNIMNSTPVRKPTGNGDSMAISKVQGQSQTSDLRPFVTRGSNVQHHPKETFVVDYNQIKNQPTSHHRVPNAQVLQRTQSHPSQPFISAVPETLGPERGQSSPVTQMISAMTTQNHLSIASDATADNPGSISSADSGFGGGVMKQGESVTNTEWPSQKNNDLSFSPPALFDLTDIVKIDEEYGMQAEGKMSAEVLTIKEERKEDDFDVEKELSSLAEVQKNEKRVAVKVTVKPEQCSPPLICATEEENHSEEEKKNNYDTSSLERKYDPNEDWCAVCNNGGDLLCCDTCPKVYHYHCHVPEIMSAPPGTWQCMLCRDINKMLEAESKYPKRKRIVGVQGKELKLCEKLTLELYCHPQSIPFHQAVRSSVPNYYQIIKKPMDLSKVKKKLLISNFQHYATVEEILEDIQQILTNCFYFNGEESTLGNMGKKLQKFFIQQVKEKFPEMSDFLEKSMEEQRHFLDTNKVDAEALKDRSTKSNTSNRKSSIDKSKLPYESDTLWQPSQDENDDEEETESTGDGSERSFEDEVVEDVVDSGDSSSSEGALKKRTRKIGRFRI